MRKFFWKLKSNGFQLISAFISRDGERVDRVFASVMKDGRKYNYDGKTLVENSGIEGKAFHPDSFNIDEIEENLPREGRHMILVGEDIKVLIPTSITTFRIIEMTRDGKVKREYETDVGDRSGL